MGNAPPTRLVIWQLTAPSEAGRRFSLSGDYLCLYHNVVDGKRLIKVNEEEKHKSIKPFDNGSTHEIVHGGAKYIVTITCNLTGGFAYSCTVNGKKLSSHLERPSVVQEDLKFKVTEAEVETIMGMRDSGDSKGEKPGEKVAMYTIEVHSKSSGTTIGSSKHRYSEFSGEDVTTMHRLCPPNQRSYSPSYPSYPSYYSSRSLRHSEVYVRQLPLGKEHSPPPSKITEAYEQPLFPRLC